MNADDLRALQAPIKDRYRADPGAAMVTLAASGSLTSGGLTCRVETGRALAEAGLHPASGGDGSALCSGDMLLWCAAIRLSFDLDTDAPKEQLDTLLKLTERYCVVAQTVKAPTPVAISIAP